MRCERCGSPAAEDFAQVFLCEMCLLAIVREWRIRKRDFEELVNA
jgi:hypothetical protein